MGIGGGRRDPVAGQARGGVAVGRAQALAGLVQVPVNGVLGQAQFAGDLLGAHVAINKAQAFALTLCEPIKADGDLARMDRPVVHPLI